MAKRWTKAETKYLRENIGKVYTENMCKKLNPVSYLSASNLNCLI